MILRIEGLWNKKEVNQKQPSHGNKSIVGGDL
jgi:hypothetical protein